MTKSDISVIQRNILNVVCHPVNVCTSDDVQKVVSNKQFNDEKCK